jgi:hypothetical protein
VMEPLAAPQLFDNVEDDVARTDRRSRRDVRDRTRTREQIVATLHARGVERLLGDA